MKLTKYNNGFELWKITSKCSNEIDRILCRIQNEHEEKPYVQINNGKIDVIYTIDRNCVLYRIEF